MAVEHDPIANPNDYLFQDPDYRAEDQKRLDAWLAGEWYFVGIRAKACIAIPYGINPACWVTGDILSPGLWGIESDSGGPYFDQVFHEERGTLIDMLKGLRNFDIVNQPQREMQS